MNEKTQADELSAEERAALEEAATRYYEKLQAAQHDQETKFDQAVLLVAGGAFTVSAAFVPQIEGQLNSPWALRIAWFSWGLCLIAAIGAYLFSADCNRYVMRLLDAGERNVEKLTCERAKWIPRVNILSFGLLVTGFLGFGIFTFNNLSFGERRNGQGQEESQEEGESARRDSVLQHRSVERPETESRLPPKKENVQGHEGVTNGRSEGSQTDATTAVPAATEGAVKAAGRVQQDRPQQGDERAEPGPGIPENDEKVDRTAAEPDR